VKFLIKTVLFLILQVPLFSFSGHAFQRTETEFFTFIWDQAEHKAARFLAQYADPVAREISESLGFKFLQRVEVYIVPTFEDFQISCFPDSYALIGPYGNVLEVRLA